MKNPCANYREQIEASIQDEICDAGFYAQIANEAPSNILRELITSIVGDEYGHARLQASLLGICPPPISTPPDCPAATGDFCADVETAIQGELGAIGRYSGLAMCAPNPDIRYLFTSILGDEYAHARIWTAMLQAPCLCHDRYDCQDASPYMGDMQQSSYMGAMQSSSKNNGGYMDSSNYR
jgi:rubrerythrin